MGAYDTSIAPTGLTPANTNEATLLEVGVTSGSPNADTQVLVSAAVVDGSTGVTIRIGVLPDSGTVTWFAYNVPISEDNPLTNLGPFFLRDGDAIRVRTNDANAVDFTVTGSYTT